MNAPRAYTQPSQPPPQSKNGDHWTLDKRFPIAILGGMVIQVVVWVWLGSAFYTQTNANQVRNEERFLNAQKQKETYDQRFDTLQKVQTEILTQLAGMSEKINSQISAQTELSRDIRDLLRKRK